MDSHAITEFYLRPYTKKELRQLYQLPKSTFIRWMERLPEFEDRGRKNWLTLEQVKAFVKSYGVPGGYIISRTDF